MVIVDLVDEDSLPVILSWWLAREMGELDPVLLPPMGFVARDESGLLASAFLYEMIDCPVAKIDWLITRPGLSPMLAREACRAILADIEEYSQACGVRMLFASACRPQMVPEIEACGFVVVARDVTHLAKAPSYDAT
jgi:hypothetical protein